MKNFRFARAGSYLTGLGLAMSLFCTTVVAQNNQGGTATTPQWRYQMGDPDGNFWTIQAAAQAYYAANPQLEGQRGDWKHFKRWEHFWEGRVDVNGSYKAAYDAMYHYKSVANTYCTSNTSGISSNWTFMGPFVVPDRDPSDTYASFGMGIITALYVDPSDPNTMYAGSNTGGLWKTTDGGNIWSNITDIEGSAGLGIAAVEAHPTNKNIVWIATGIGSFRNNYGVGVLKSTDYGATWNTTGLSYVPGVQEKVTHDILLHPTDPNILWVGAQNELYKSTDGGATFTLVHTVPVGQSIYDLEMRPGDPNTIYAATKLDKAIGVEATLWKSTSGGGPGSWVDLTPTLAVSGSDRISIAVTEVNPNVLYAGVSTASGGNVSFQKSTNSGVSWGAPFVSSVGGGYWKQELVVSPIDEDEVYIGGLEVWKSTDGAQSFSNVSDWANSASPVSMHADVRDMAFIKLGPSSARVYTAHDGGIGITDNGAATWTDVSGSNLGITQFYGIGTSDYSDRIYGGCQDLSTNYIDRTNSEWKNTSWGDGGDCIVHPTNPNLVYGAVNGSFYYSSDGGTNFSINNDGGFASLDFPMEMNPQNANEVFLGKWDVYKGDPNVPGSWVPISDLNNDRIRALAVAPSDPDVIYMAELGTTWGSTTTNAGAIWKTTDGGANPVTSWTDISDGLEGLKWAAISDITVDPNNAQRIWVTFQRFWDGNKVYHSPDGGSTWINVSAGIPNLPVNCIVYEEGTNDGLYIGTDAGVFYKDASMSSWECYSDQLPACMVTDLEINYCSRKLLAGTFGRGLWESDLAVTPSAQIINSGTVTWSSPLRLGTDLVIEPGSELTITTEVNIARGVTITVKPGARLIVDGGTLTNYCGEMWEGINVWGDYNTPQGSVSTSPQGVVIIRNNSLIENAHEAVRLWEPGNYGSTGGIVVALESTFRNNWRSAEFISYQNYASNGTTIIDNKSYFSRCTFETSQESLNNGSTPAAHITMWKVRGINITGCTFINTTTNPRNLRGYGVYTIDAKYRVRGYCSSPTIPCGSYVNSRFEGLYYGIASQSANPIYNLYMDHTDFVDNWRGTLLRGMDYANVTNCNYDVGAPFGSQSSYGLYTDHCSAYKIQLNNFYSNFGGTIGSYAWESGSAPNKINNNTYDNLIVGAYASGDNSGLEFRCNKFTNIPNADIAVSSGAIYTLQGFCSSGVSEPAGNEFSYGAGTDIYTNPGVAFFAYFHHTGAPYEPLAAGASVGPADCGLTYNASDCAIPTTGFPWLVAKKNALITEIDELVEKYDDGRKAELLALINSNASAGQVKNALLGAGPYLSDEVLIASLNDKPTPLPAGHVKQIILANSPVTNDVMLAIDNRSPSLPNGIKNQINSAQTGTSARDDLDTQIERKKRELFLVEDEMIRVVLNDEALSTKYEEVIALLLEQRGHDAKCKLLAAYIANREFTKAEALKEEIKQDGGGVLDPFCQLQEVLIQMNEDQQNCFQLPPDKESKIRDIAYQDKKGCANAQAILELAYSEKFDELIEPLLSANFLWFGSQEEPIEVLPEATELSLANRPNPFNDETVIMIDGLPSDFTEGRLVIYSITGVKVADYPVTKDTYSVVFGRDGVGDGIYFYTLYQGDRVLKTNKMLIVH